MATQVHYPFQCIEYVERQASNAPKIIVASAGPKLYSFSAVDGRKLFTWPQTDISSNGANFHGTGERRDSGGDGPPEKRRKLSPCTEDAEKAHAKASKSNDQKHIHPSASWSTIPILVSSPTGRHIIAITAEDKCVRVFEIGIGGILSQLSERCVYIFYSTIDEMQDAHQK
jgi:tRNA (guanine-N(7)-)-methyltransferase subunit TRM82